MKTFYVFFLGTLVGAFSTVIGLALETAFATMHIAQRMG